MPIQVVDRPLPWKQSRSQFSLKNVAVSVKTEWVKTLEPRLLPSEPKDNHNAQNLFHCLLAWFNCWCKIFVRCLGGVWMTWSGSLTPRIWCPVIFFPTSVQRSQIGGGPLHNFTFALTLVDFKESKGRESSLHFVARVTCSYLFQPPGDEEGNKPQSDSYAKSCNDRLWWVPAARFACKAVWICFVRPWPVRTLLVWYFRQLWYSHLTWIPRSFQEKIPQQTPDFWFRAGHGWYCHIFAGADPARR